MTSPRSMYGGGYSSAAFPDTPIYDSLVAERGTPQIAPIRVPAAYEAPVSHLPALPSALPALPAAPSQPSYGYPQAPQPAPLQQAHTAYIPQQATAPRGYPGPQPQPPRQPQPAGYEAMRPAAPRPAPAPYQDPYGNQQPQQQYRGY
ncbi:DUF6643 family protein [Streptomyces sp. NPDC005908]|uniref:Uncharacterized protein n=1 Tax=Streptomyces tendae TaxID=1932 RepID=A0ABX5ZU69_STRTE|nr:MULTISPECIES: DUF6643 family protein [Streptomyces]QER88203.1 hypothetical protein F3L20_22325 [Streptomyces tendae]TWD25455.1 hypothetical protein FB570_103239 [Streptomyces sp. T12]